MLAQLPGQFQRLSQKVGRILVVYVQRGVGKTFRMVEDQSGV
jgi:hypothetical protein